MWGVLVLIYLVFVSNFQIIFTEYKYLLNCLLYYYKYQILNSIWFFCNSDLNHPHVSVPGINTVEGRFSILIYTKSRLDALFFSQQTIISHPDVCI